MNSHSILPASCTSSCLMLMIWSRPRAEQITRSCRLVLLRPHRSLRCGDRIMLLDSRESRKRICKLPGLRHENLAISSQQSRQKTTLAQWVRNSSRATSYFIPIVGNHLLSVVRTAVITNYNFAWHCLGHCGFYGLADQMSSVISWYDD